MVNLKNILILRRRQAAAFRTGSKAPLSINPEQTLGFRPGIVEGLIFCGEGEMARLDKKDVLRMAKEKEVRFVRLWFTDILGFLKSFAITKCL